MKIYLILQLMGGHAWRCMAGHEDALHCMAGREDAWRLSCRILLQLLHDMPVSTTLPNIAALPSTWCVTLAVAAAADSRDSKKIAGRHVMAIIP